MPQAQQAPFFWLHIKKSAGTTTRAMLTPDYTLVDWRNKPGSFIQAQPAQYNDILNNFRTLIGEYQFRRALFAKTFLYPDSWDDLCSFAFSREPMQRCISMFHYMMWKREGLKGYPRNLSGKFRSMRSFHLTPRSTFDFMLDNIEAAQASDHTGLPLGLHFTTHTARMWQDITDDDGTELLRYVFKLDSLVPALNQVFAECGLQRRFSDVRSTNVTSRGNFYEPTATQRRRIEELYVEDFELHERALTVS